MPFLMSLALEHEIVTLAWVDNASVQFPLNIYATKGIINALRCLGCQSLTKGGKHGTSDCWDGMNPNERQGKP